MGLQITRNRTGKDGDKGKDRKGDDHKKEPEHIELKGCAEGIAEQKSREKSQEKDGHLRVEHIHDKSLPVQLAQGFLPDLVGLQVQTGRSPQYPETQIEQIEGPKDLNGIEQHGVEADKGRYPKGQQGCMDQTARDQARVGGQAVLFAVYYALGQDIDIIRPGENGQGGSSKGKSP